MAASAASARRIRSICKAALAAVSGEMQQGKKRTVAFIDVVAAFLHADVNEDGEELEEEIYLRAPPEMGLGPGECLKVSKAMYGLRRAPRQWQIKRDRELIKMGFIVSTVEPNMYYNKETGVRIVFHVDDALVTGDPDAVDKCLEWMKTTLTIKLMGYLHAEGDSVMNLGKKIVRIEGGFLMHDTDWRVDELIEIYGLQKAKTAVTPGIKEAKSSEADDELLSPEEHRRFREVLGKLIFLSRDRADITFSVKEAAKGLAQPTVRHRTAVKRIIRYLKGARSLPQMIKMKLERGEIPKELMTYSDSDWGGSSSDRRSTTGTVVQWGSCTIAVASRTQSSVTLSSAESEYFAMCSSAKEAIYFKNLLHEMGYEVGIRLCVDSSAAKANSEKMGSSAGRMKHIALRMLYLKQLINSKLVRTMKVGTHENLADILTKHVGADTCTTLRSMIGLMDVDQMTVDKIENKENDIGAQNKKRFMKSGTASVNAMIAMIITSELAHVDALKTAKNDPEFEMWKWFMLNWVAVLATVMLVLFVVLWRSQTKEKRIIMKHAETQTTLSLYDDGRGVGAFPTMKQSAAAMSPVIYLAKYGQKYHCRINCQGLNAADKAKVVTYERCYYCTDG